MGSVASVTTRETVEKKRKIEWKKRKPTIYIYIARGGTGYRFRDRKCKTYTNAEREEEEGSKMVVCTCTEQCDRLHTMWARGGVATRGLFGNAWGAYDPWRESSTQIIRVEGRRRREMNRDAFPSELCARALTPVVIRAARDTSGLITAAVLRCCVIFLRDKASQGWRKSGRICPCRLDGHTVSTRSGLKLVSSCITRFCIYD